MNDNYPILDYDANPEAILQPDQILPKIDISPACVLCFFQDVLSDLKQTGHLRQVYELGSEIGPNPVFELDVNGRQVAVCHPGVGAPLAAGFLDELIALGCRQFIAAGGCGVLDSEIGVGQVVVPATAVRAEGTSYHYLPPSHEVAASAQVVNAIEQTLARHHLPYVVGKTWTTDAPYRETRALVQKRKAEGCLVVEMEAAALFAVAQFRGVLFGQILYGGDDLMGDQWDSRGWQKMSSTREKLFWLAVEAALKL